jgi:hypothetical protein
MKHGWTTPWNKYLSPNYQVALMDDAVERVSFFRLSDRIARREKRCIEALLNDAFQLTPSLPPPPFPPQSQSP